MESETVKLTVRLPKSHVAFAKSYSNGDLPRPNLESITGLAPADIDAEAEYRRHLRDKHSR
jgi:hypothetical protein